MAFELLLDENLEHDVLSNLRNRNHDVEHVEFVTELGKGTATMSSRSTPEKPIGPSSPTTTISGTVSLKPSITDSFSFPTTRFRAGKSRLFSTR